MGESVRGGRCKETSLVLVGCLILSVLSLSGTYAASTTPKPGALCKKIGTTIKYKTLTYTCVKSLRKLVWSKGVVVKPAVPDIPVTPPDVQAGLLERSYQGYFADDRAFFKSTPTSSSVVDGVDLREQHDGKAEFSKQWTGYFVPNATGKWTFEISSDDSSHFWLGASALTLSSFNSSIISIAGVHGPITRTTDLYLKQGEAYPLRMIWGNSINFAQMTFVFSSPNGVRQSDGRAFFWHSTSTDGINIFDFPSPVLPKTALSLDVFKGAPRDEVALSVQALLDAASASGKQFTGAVTWRFEGDTSDFVENYTKDIFTTSADFFTKLGFATTGAIVLNGLTSDWQRSQIAGFGCTQPNLPDAAGGYYVPSATCIGGNGVVTAPHWNWIATNDGNSDIDALHFHHILPHEYFHQLQHALSGGVGNGAYPLWLWEGGAHFFSLIAYAQRNSGRFYEQWAETWFTIQEPPLKSGCVGVNVFDMANSENGDKRFCGYSKGSVIVEYLVSKYGVNKYQDLISEQARTGRPFREVFKLVCGLDLETFYKGAADFLKSRGWD